MSNSHLRPGDDLFLWIGKCITAWARVEEHLFEICVTALGTTKQKTAIIYYRTPTLDARLKLTDELIRTTLPKRERKDGGHDHPDLTNWDNIRKEIGDTLPIRNRLAHHPVANRTIDGATGAVAELFSWHEIYESDSEQLRGHREKPKPLLAPDLGNHRLAIEQLITKLELFRKHVLSKYAE
jgi:hypothetical protein